MEQTNIDTKYTDEFDGLISDIEARMHKLKGSDPGSQSSTAQSPTAITINEESEDEETTVKKIVEKVSFRSVSPGGSGPQSTMRAQCVLVPVQD